ncbi:hypothetical protein [Microseira wollei]|nr:hypothetical protein [Microseira wollei]
MPELAYVWGRATKMRNSGSTFNDEIDNISVLTQVASYLSHSG